MAYFKTHHYGGIRKYQWVTIPLELHGVAVLRDGVRTYDAFAEWRRTHPLTGIVEWMP